MAAHGAGNRPPLTVHTPVTQPVPQAQAQPGTALPPRLPEQPRAQPQAQAAPLAERVQQRPNPASFTAIARLALTALGLTAAAASPTAEPNAIQAATNACAGVNPPGLLDELATVFRKAWDAEARGTGSVNNGQFYIAQDTFDESVLEAWTATVCGGAHPGDETEAFITLPKGMTLDEFRAIDPNSPDSGDEFLRLILDGTQSGMPVEEQRQRYIALADPGNPNIRLKLYPLAAGDLLNDPRLPRPGTQASGVVTLRLRAAAVGHEPLPLFQRALTTRPAALIVGTSGRKSSEKVVNEFIAMGYAATTVPLGNGEDVTVISTRNELPHLRPFVAAHAARNASLKEGRNANKPASDAASGSLPGGLGVVATGVAIGALAYLGKRMLALQEQRRAQQGDAADLTPSGTAGNTPAQGAPDTPAQRAPDAKINPENKRKKGRRPPPAKPKAGNPGGEANITVPMGTSLGVVTDRSLQPATWQAPLPPESKVSAPLPKAYVLRDVTDEVRASLAGNDKETRKVATRQWGLRLGLAMADPNPLRRVEAAGILLGLADSSHDSRVLALRLAQLQTEFLPIGVINAVKTAHEETGLLNSELRSSAAKLDDYRHLLLEAATIKIQNDYKAEKGRLGSAPQDKPTPAGHPSAPQAIKQHPNVTLNLAGVARDIRSRCATQPGRPGEFFVGPVNGEVHLHVGQDFIILKKQQGSNYEICRGDQLMGNHLRDARAHVEQRLRDNPLLAPIAAELNALWQLVEDDEAKR